jgi:nucleoside-diphosphate-sugar epimerase
MLLQSGDLYALSRIVREKLLVEECGTTGVPLAILRPTAIYGAADTHNSYRLNRLLRLALREARITLFGRGEEERDHVYINDVTALAEMCFACQASLVGSTNRHRDISRRGRDRTHRLAGIDPSGP